MNFNSKTMKYWQYEINKFKATGLELTNLKQNLENGIGLEESSRGQEPSHRIRKRLSPLMGKEFA